MPDLPAEIRFLLAVAAAGLGGAPPRAAAGLDWPRLTAWLRHHRLQPLLAPALTPEAGVPDAARAELAALHRAGQMRAMRLAAEAARLARAFDQAGVAVLMVKGPALSALLYGDPCRRSCRDLDLLVRAGDEAAARQVLGAAGYGLGDDGVLCQANAVMLRHGGGNAPVELHVRLADDDRLLPLAALRPFDGAVKVDVAGAAVPTPDIDTALVYAAFHGAAHHWSRLYWLADFAAAARHPGVDWPRVAAIARRTGTGRHLAAAVALCGLLPGVTLPAPALAVADGARGAGPAVAVAHRMLACPPAIDRETLRRVGVLRVLWADLALQGNGRAAWALLAARMRASDRDVTMVRLPPALAFLYPLVRLLRVAVLALGPRAKTGRGRR